MILSPICIGGFFVAAIVTGFHGCALYVSVTSNELKKIRFLRLALFLSLSDIAIGIEFMYGILLNQLGDGSDAVKFQCMMIKDIIGGSILSSLLQTLVICLERLNATFTVPRRILQILTGNIAIGLCFAIPHCYTLIRFGINAADELVPCDPKYTIGGFTLLTHDVPVALVITTIAVVYGIVAKRMVNQQNTMLYKGSNLTKAQMEKNKLSALRMKKNMTTLGMIISVAVLSALPRGVIGLYAYVDDSYDTIEPYLTFCNNVLILATPLLDPAIYLFRVKKYREQLMCACCRRSSE